MSGRLLKRHNNNKMHVSILNISIIGVLLEIDPYAISVPSKLTIKDVADIVVSCFPEIKTKQKKHHKRSTTHSQITPFINNPFIITHQRRSPSSCSSRSPTRRCRCTAPAGNCVNTLTLFCIVLLSWEDEQTVGPPECLPNMSLELVRFILQFTALSLFMSVPPT